MLLSDAVEGYWLTRRRSLSQATVDDYTLTFDRLQTFTHDAEFERITAADINRFLAAYSHLATKSQLNMWIALSALWTWAEKELGTPHVVRNVDRPHPQPPVIQPYSEDEVRAMLTATAWGNAYVPAHDTYTEYRLPNADRDRAILIVLLDCGLRASELCALTIGDYDRKRGSLHIRSGKGDKPRIIYVGDSSRRALWRYLRHRDNDKRAPLFLSATGKHLTRSGLRKLVQRIADRAHVDGATVHRFRHTFAIQFLRNGGNLFALRAMLGHSTLEMVRTYARLADLDIATAQRIASPGDNWQL